MIGFDAYDIKNGQIVAAAAYAYTDIRQSGAGSGAIISYIAGVYDIGYSENAYVEVGLWGAFTLKIAPRIYETVY